VAAQRLEDDGTYPNNPRLPLLLYRGALNLPAQGAEVAIEALFRGNGWGGTWRNGIYGFHHYHSTAHEVLGVSRGTVVVQLGGDAGITVSLRPGDVVVIPAGVAHKNLSASGDLLVVGAYPPGQRPDMNDGRTGERPAADERIARVPTPGMDPVYGADGPLIQHWRGALPD
jgi:uncharacterized protein YjlB